MVSVGCAAVSGSELRGFIKVRVDGTRQRYAGINGVNACCPSTGFWRKTYANEGVLKCYVFFVAIPDGRRIFDGPLDVVGNRRLRLLGR